MDVTTERLKFVDEYPDEAGKLAQRLHIKKDEIPFIRKYFIDDKVTDDVDKKDRTIVSRISCSNKDREGESLLPEGVVLDNYNNNPIVCWGHSYGDPKNYIGKNLWIRKDDKGLVAKTAFAKTEFADQVFRAYTEDVAGTGPLLKGFSVGFIPLEWEDGDHKDKLAPRRTYTKWELLEYSCVGIPCSPESLTIAEEKGVISKGFSDRIKKEYKLVDVAREDEPEAEIEKPKFKERWNKSFSKIFDVERVSSNPSTFEYALLEKFLECSVNKIYKNNHFIPFPLMGTYLAGIKAVLGDYKLKDTRNFSYGGSESPPEYEVVKLSSTESDDFLVQGTAFYDADNVPLAVKFSPSWFGIDVSFCTRTTNMKWNKELLLSALNHAKKHNKLRGEKFALNGEFLDKTDDSWDNLILDGKYKDVIHRSIRQLEKRGENSPSRGLLFIGRPGTGKTKTGRVILSETDSTFIWISSRDFKKIDPLRAISLAFDMARDLTPSVLFFEDIDTWLADYTVDLMKTELDGIKQNKGVVTILTSNFPEKLPDALLDRPGRFHHIVDFVLPGKAQRKEMLGLWAGEIDSDVLEKILEQTDGFSGAHMAELIDYAKMIVEDDEIDISKALLKSLEKMMDQKELIEQIKEDKKDYSVFMEKAREYETKTLTAVLEPDDHADLKEELSLIKSQLAELKEGRVLSSRNRDLVKSVLDAVDAVREPLQKLYDATDPAPAPTEDDEKAVEVPPVKVAEVKKLSPERIGEMVKNALTSERIGRVVATELNKMKGKID